MKKRGISILLALMAFSSFAFQESIPSTDEIISLQEAVFSIEEQLQTMKEDYQTLYDSISVQNVSISPELQEFLDLLFSQTDSCQPISLDKDAIYIGKDTKIYIGETELIENE